MKAVILVLTATAAIGSANLFAGQQEDALEWLEKAASAARKLDYHGTFVYQHGSQVDTSRVFHLSDAAGDHARLVALDGPPREIVRNNDEIRCYYPETKTVKIERRTGRASFPALVPEQISRIGEYYRVKKGGMDRVAGYDCQLIFLKPKDSFRYGRVFCAESKSGLLLKSKTINDKDQVMEQITFIEVHIGADIDRDMLEPSFSVAPGEWKIDRSAVSETVGGTEWGVQSPPPGFKKIQEMKRNVEGKTAPVSHLVFSDGLAAVSVFVEPLASSTIAAPGVSQQGAINIYTRSVGEDYRATVLGEAPPVTVMQIGNSLTHTGKSASRP
ncbi:MAG TPA: MucB/RseB C-terminal domain-containing protein [Burkholderiales bacterium]|nr:MucB/RseB C-terminal domain-containing protein [Burkholderiales bacterium]